MPLSRSKYFQTMGYTPHSELQRSMHASPARFKISVCGRRFGKSTWSANEMSYHMFDRQKPKKRYWLVGDTYDVCAPEFEILWKNVMETLNMSKRGAFGSTSLNQGNAYIELPWKTRVEVRSADKPRKIMGRGLAGVIMCEPKLHREETWEKYIRPALADEHGWAIFPGTPEGYNFLYDLFVKGQSDDPEWSEYESWQAPSWTNPIVFPGGINDPEIESARKAASSPAWFDQEYGAQFTTYEGKIYPTFENPPGTHVVDWLTYQPALRNFWGIDFGWSADWVCLDIQIDEMDNVYVWREYYENFKSTHENGDYLIRKRVNPPGYRIDGVFCDPNDPGEAATLQGAIGRMVHYDKTPFWSEGVEAIRKNLKIEASTGKPKFFVSRNCPKFISQMHQLSAPKETRTADARPGQAKKNDHGPDALRYFFNHVFILGHGSRLSDAYALEDRGPQGDPDLSSFLIEPAMQDSGMFTDFDTGMAGMRF